MKKCEKIEPVCTISQNEYCNKNNSLTILILFILLAIIIGGIAYL